MLDWAACRGVAQSGSAPVWGTGGRRFKSGRPDHSFPHGPTAARLHASWVPSQPGMGLLDVDLDARCVGSVDGEGDRLPDEHLALDQIEGDGLDAGELGTVRLMVSPRSLGWATTLNRCVPSMVSRLRPYDPFRPGAGQPCRCDGAGGQRSAHEALRACIGRPAAKRGVRRGRGCERERGGEASGPLPAAPPPGTRP
jgi:hypothetical protein